MLSNVDELMNNVCWLELIQLNFDKSVISPKQVAIMQSKGKPATKQDPTEAAAEGEEQVAAKDSKHDQHLSFVEFLDFLLRLFHSVFSDSMHPMAEKKYTEQIKYGMDLLLDAYKEKIHGHGDPKISIVSAEEIEKLQD